MILNKQAIYLEASVTELNKSVLIAVEFLQDLTYCTN